MRILALAILAIGTVSAAAPAQAQTYDPGYPVCLHVYGRITYYECSYYIAASMQRVGLGPLGAMRDQSLFRTCISRAAGTPLQALPQRCLLSAALFQFDDLAVDQRHPPVHPAGELHVVGRDQHRDLRRLHQLHQRLEHVIGGVRIEVSGRLVRQQHPRRIGDRARDGDALLLAAGQFGRPVRDAVAEAEIGQDFLRALDGLGAS